MIRTLQDEILKEKKRQNAVILAHSYQSPDILEISDYQGDSYFLSVLAQDLTEKKVILCGVRFMAETVKMLSPDKTVILPVAEATCPMAEQISPQRVLDFKKEHPDYKVVAYVNTSAALKAVCDVCVTSSSALKIVEKMDAKNILFIPDKNLGSYVQKMLPQKNIILWDGYCPVHNSVTTDDVLQTKKRYPNLKLLMHPELPSEVLAYGDVIGSTADILKYARNHKEDCIIGTEKSISDTLKLEMSEFHHPLLSKKLICPDMRLTTLSDVYHALTGQGGEEIILDEEIRTKAKHTIDEMIRLGQ
jgi:quinolinate synthase